MFYDEYPFYNRFRNNDNNNLSNTGHKAYGNGDKKNEDENYITNYAINSDKALMKFNDFNPDSIHFSLRDFKSLYI